MKKLFVIGAALVGVLVVIVVVFTHGAMASPAVLGASPDGIWTEISEAGLSVVGERRIVPLRYRTFVLDGEGLQARLGQAAMEFSPQAQQGSMQIALPLPDGSYGRFIFVESPVMAPELAAKFTEIHTYVGKGVDDPTASVRFDLTPHGFHAMILSSGDTVFIDPYSWGDTQTYISYYRGDYPRTQIYNEIEPIGDTEAIRELANRVAAENLGSGNQLRTYRVAIAATGEYTTYHGGTVASAMAEIVTALNRVTGVYEREVAVRMVLVANNNLVVYTDAASDPYSNTNGSAMLSQNQTTLDSVIGNANYDIGHVFSTGGGGVAYLGVVCDAGYKARGVTGLSAPVGDAFYIDYVAHEMGHQFSGNHTFNGDSGSCSGSNRNASTAYEPGSGTTIMAYAGICSPQNIQSNSDAYFHGASYEEIIAYTQLGYGNTCAVKTNTGNAAPVVVVPPGGFTIPVNTPFTLSGSATDANGDPLTYSWEEFDLGAAGHPDTPTGNAPIFRSFSPVSTPSRTFPKMIDIVKNLHVMGELLPAYTRVLTFRLTARDNHFNPSAGGVGFATISFNVSSNAGPFTVTTPNTAVTWNAGVSQTVTWNVANTDISPVNCNGVNILLSRDGGYTYPVTLLANTPNDGTEAVVIPKDPLNVVTTARVKVACANNIFFDISNVNFTITAINQLPVVDLNGGAEGIDYATTFTEDGGAVSIVTPDLMVTDADDSSLDKATVTITNLQNGLAESLSASAAGAISSGAISYNPATGVLTIDPAGTVPLADFQAVLRSVTYQNSSQNPGATARLVDFMINDGFGGNNPLARSTVSIVRVNDAPSFVKGSDIVAVQNCIACTYPSWATAISPGPEEVGQTLVFTLTADNPALFLAQPVLDASTGTLTFTLSVGATGSTTVTVLLKDNGGTANGGVDTYTEYFVITIYLPNTWYYLPFVSR